MEEESVAKHYELKNTSKQDYKFEFYALQKYIDLNEKNKIILQYKYYLKIQIMQAEGSTNNNINNLPLNYAEIAYPYLMFYQDYNQFGTKIYFFQPNMINNLSYSTNKFAFNDQNIQNPNLNDLTSDTLRTLKTQQESGEVKLEYQTQEEKNIGTLRNIKKIYQEEKKKNIKQKDEKKEKTEKKGKKFNKGHWTQKEQRSFEMFLLKNESMMQDPDEKKQKKIFKLMSTYVKTRSPNQCRSHHQKFSKLLDEDI
ncbi:hypothetical protein pb186bvf_014660 [Paramecium bursaria]